MPALNASIVLLDPMPVHTNAHSYRAAPTPATAYKLILMIALHPFSSSSVTHLSRNGMNQLLVTMT